MMNMNNIIIYIIMSIIFVISITCLVAYFQGLMYSNPIVSGWYMGWTQWGFFASFFCSVTIYYLFINRNLLSSIISGIIFMATFVIFLKRFTNYIKIPQEKKEKYYWVFLRKKNKQPERNKNM